MTAVPPSLPHHVQALVVRAGGIDCAIPVAHVVETMRSLPTTSLDDMPAFARGLATVRGEAVPVLDLGALLGLAPADRRRFVTVRAGNRTAALSVDEVIGLSTFDAAELSARPSIVSEGIEALVSAVAIKDSGLHLLLDAARIVGKGDGIR
jgi:purine-binding chemotaxis protein CheW